MDDIECLKNFPGSQDYYRYFTILDQFQNLETLSLEDCQTLGEELVSEYLSEDPSAALYAEAIENPKRFSSHNPETGAEMTHLAVYGVCSLPKLKDLNTYLDPATADQFMAELRSEVVSIVSRSNILFSINGDDIFSSDHPKGLVLHYPLQGNDYTEEDIRNLNRAIADQTKSALLRLLPKYIDEPYRDTFTLLDELQEILQDLKRYNDYSEEEILDMEQRAYHQPGLSPEAREDLLATVRVYRELELVRAEHFAAKAKAIYLGTLEDNVKKKKGVGFLFGVSRIKFDNTQDRQKTFLDAMQFYGDSVRGARQAANRKQVFDNGIGTDVYDIFNTQSLQAVGETYKPPSLFEQRDDTQEYSQAWYVRDVLGARSTLVTDYGLDRADIEELEHKDELKVLFERNKDGDLVLTKKGALILRKYDAFKHTDEYQALSPNQRSVLDAMVKQDWFNVVEFADYLKMVQLEFTNHYRLRIDNLLDLRKRLRATTSVEEAREILQAIEEEYATSHKCEPEDNALTVYGRLKAMLTAGRGIAFIADAVGLGARNKKDAYEENTLKIVKICLDVIRSDLPDKLDQYLQIFDCIELPGDERDTQILSGVAKLKELICEIADDPENISSDKIVTLFERSYVANEFFKKWYLDFVPASAKEQIKSIGMVGADKVTAQLKEETHELCGDVFKHGYRQKGDEVEGIGSIENNSDFEELALFEDFLLANYQGTDPEDGFVNEHKYRLLDRSLDVLNNILSNAFDIDIDSYSTRYDAAEAYLEALNDAVIIRDNRVVDFKSRYKTKVEESLISKRTLNEVISLINQQFVIAEGRITHLYMPTIILNKDHTVNDLVEYGRRLYTSYVNHFAYSDPDVIEADEEEEELLARRNMELPKDNYFYYVIGKAVKEFLDSGFSKDAIIVTGSNTPIDSNDHLYPAVAENIFAAMHARNLEQGIRSDLAITGDTKFRVNLVLHDVPVRQLISNETWRRATAIALSTIDQRAENSFNALKGYTNIGQVPPESEDIVRVHSIKSTLSEMGLNTDDEHDIRYSKAA